MTRRRAAQVVLLISLALLVWRGAQYVALAARAIGYRYQLDYGEGIVWEQSRLMFTPAAYGPIDSFPAIVFHYTPVFHSLTRLIALILGIDGLAAGRLTSVMATLVVCVLAGTLTLKLLPSTDRRERFVSAGTSALLVVSLYPVAAWSVLMRVDMLSHAFSLAGLTLALTACRNPRVIYLAALCFLLAVFTKQTAIAAPAAFLTVAASRHRALALRCLATCLVGGLVALGIMTAVTDGGFMRHVFAYNVNRLNWRQLGALGEVLVEALPLIGAATLALLRILGDPSPRADSDAGVSHQSEQGVVTARQVVMTYALINTLLLTGFLKSGAAYNYAIEWLLALCILAGTMAGALVREALRGDLAFDIRFASRKLAAGVLIVKQASMSAEPYQTSLHAGGQLAAMTALETRLTEARGPIVSDDMVLLIRAGKRIELEPAIITELTSMGTWDESAFLRRIEAREFAMFVTQLSPDDADALKRFTPTVWRAMKLAYPETTATAGLLIHTP